MRSRNLLFGIAVVLTACGGTAVSGSADASPTIASAASSAPTTTTSASTAPSSTATAAPTAQPAGSVALSVEGDAPLLIASRGTGFIALGVEHAWVSDDGLAWDSAETEGILGGAQVRLIERADGALLAFGFDPGPATQLRTWTSPDGYNWQETDIGVPNPFAFLDVARNERGYVLVGRSLRPDASPEQLWFSPDAITWELVYGTSEDESLAAVGSGPEGFVAVGQQGFRTGPSRAFVLASADGREWLRPAAGGVLADSGSLWSVAPLNGDWVTSPSTVGTELPMLWSPNGLDWEERTSFPIERNDVGVIASLMSNGSRLYAAVADGGGQAVSSVMSTSLDATEWSETEIPLTERWNFATAGGVDVFLVNGTVHVLSD